MLLSVSDFDIVYSLMLTNDVGLTCTRLHWLGLRRGAFACVGWQVALCDLM